jgi:hypothetical protein
MPSPTERTVAIIQARMTSTRLPGKVLADIGGKPALQRLIERLQPSALLDEITVATTARRTDYAGLSASAVTAAMKRMYSAGMWRPLLHLGRTSSFELRLIAPCMMRASWMTPSASSVRAISTMCRTLLSGPIQMVLTSR